MIASGSAVSVLCVDDDPGSADRVARNLERADDRIVARSVTAGAAGLSHLSETDVDCIVSEYEMQGMDGLEFLADVREDYPDLPFVLFTGSGSETVAEDAIEAGVSSYLPKESDADQYAVLANRILEHVEQYRTSKHARTLEAEYEMIAQTATDMFWSVDVTTGAMTVSGWVSQFGYDPEEIDPDLDWWYDRLHPDDRDRVHDHDEALFARDETAFDELTDDRGSFSHEFRWRRADGTYADCHERGIVLFEDDEPVKMAGTMSDVTERNERERVLRALNAVADDLADHETVEGICERSIEASQDILQFDLSVINVEEDGFLAVVATSDDIPESGTTTFSIEEGLAGKTYRTGESLLVDDLETRSDANPQGPYRSAISIPIGTHGVFQAVAEAPDAFDETDLELAELLISHTASALDRLDREQQLHHQNERLEEFTRIVSHDLRNPLNVLEGYIDLAREDCESAHLVEAADVLSRMESILEDTLTLASEGRIVDEMEVVRLDAIVGDCWRNVATESATLDVASDVQVRADPDRLRHVFENLFRNAIEHGGPDVAVSVGGLEDGFYVEDDGPGIPTEHRETALESGRTWGGNSGFGLSIVRQISEAHGWTVRVTEGAEGGARFEFSGVDGQHR